MNRLNMVTSDRVDEVRKENRRSARGSYQGRLRKWIASQTVAIFRPFNAHSKHSFFLSPSPPPFCSSLRGGNFRTPMGSFHSDDLSPSCIHEGSCRAGLGMHWSSSPQKGFRHSRLTQAVGEIPPFEFCSGISPV
jgi:hypothetical protein